MRRKLMYTIPLLTLMSLVLVSAGVFGTPEAEAVTDYCQNLQGCENAARQDCEGAENAELCLRHGQGRCWEEWGEKCLASGGETPW